MDISQFSYTELALIGVTTFTVVCVIRAWLQARNDYQNAIKREVHIQKIQHR